VPELPDIVVYQEALASRTVGAVLRGTRVASPFVVRSADPPLASVAGARVQGVERMGKRLVLALEGERFLVLHLMVAGRLQWKPLGAPVPGRVGLMAFDFEARGTLLFVEASGKKRASLHLVAGRAGLAAFDRGGLEVLQADLPAFEERLTRERHTLKRSLTDPTLFSGIGNAYSDEILHAARLSPVRMSDALTQDEVRALYGATRATLTLWTERLRAEAERKGWPEKVTAFRPEMAVHGKYREPCPVCGAPVQRIVHAENETNYCAGCQNGGRLLADRSLSRLLRKDWPRSLAELDERPAAKTR